MNRSPCGIHLHPEPVETCFVCEREAYCPLRPVDQSRALPTWFRGRHRPVDEDLAVLPEIEVEMSVEVVEESPAFLDLSEASESSVDQPPDSGVVPLGDLELISEIA